MKGSLRQRSPGSWDLTIDAGMKGEGMSPYALFINGIYRSVLEEILETQAGTPDRILFLQPFSKSPIVKLATNPPSPEDPVTLYISITTALSEVSYTAEIVGWEDKTVLSQARRNQVNEIIAKYQPEELELFDGTAGISNRNLISIQKLVKIGQPFTVSRLVKVSDGRPLSAKRTTSGGWAYVYPTAP